MQLQPNYGSDTVTHMFNVQNRPKTKYFYHSFLGFYITPSDPKEYVWFLPYITVINALFLCTDPLNLCDFCMRIEVQVTSFNIQWCIRAIQMLSKKSHSTKWTKILWPYQNWPGSILAESTLSLLNNIWRVWHTLLEGVRNWWGKFITSNKEEQRPNRLKIIEPHDPNRLTMTAKHSSSSDRVSCCSIVRSKDVF